MFEFVFRLRGAGGCVHSGSHQSENGMRQTGSIRKGSEILSDGSHRKGGFADAELSAACKIKLWVLTMVPRRPAGRRFLTGGLKYITDGIE